MTARHTLHYLLVMSLLAALRGAAGHPSPATTEPTGSAGAASGDSSRVIVILGSSTAAGTGATSPDSSWVGRLRAFVARTDSTVRVINLAIGGFTTYDIMPSGYMPPAGRPAPKPAGNITRGLSFRPWCIIINLPSNDAAQGYGVSESLANYDSILTAVPSGLGVWVTTTQPRNLDTAGRAALLALRDSMRARTGIHVLDFWTTLANPDGTLNAEFDAGDGIHLNDAGHRILAERVIASDLGLCLRPGRGKKAHCLSRDGDGSTEGVGADARPGE